MTRKPRRELMQCQTRIKKVRPGLFSYSSLIYGVVILIVSLSLAGCDDKGKSKPKSQNTAQKASTASSKNTASGTSVSARKTTSKPKGTVPYIDPVLAYKGETLYLQNCVFCHQADAIGKPGVAPSLTNKEFLSIAPVNFLFETIRDGRPGTGMPPFKHLGDKKIAAIVAFLRDHATLPSRIKEVLKQPESHGDPRLGKLFFKQICATCHGPNGDGYAAGGTGTAIGKRGFLDKVSDGFIRTTIKEGRSNTRMLSFQGPQALADLSDKEIDDIIAYMRTAPGEKKK